MMPKLRTMIRNMWKKDRHSTDTHPSESDINAAQRRADDARIRAQRRAKQHQNYQVLGGLFRVDPDEHWATLKMIIKWGILSSLVGILAGTASAIFLITLQWATNTRLARPELLFLLPVIGLILGWIYYRFAGAAARGNNLVIEEVNANKEPIPAKMAPLVLLGTILTHLFGGSAGREGTAIQMGSSLADWLQRRLHLSQEDRRMMLMAGISGGFGSVFGTPVAGFVFGLEVQSVGRIRYEGILPCLIAAVVGDLVTRAWGATHSHYPAMVHMETDPVLLLKVALAGLICGITSLLFIELTHAIKKASKHLLHWSPLRPVMGGLIIIGLVVVVGSQDYLGLSLPLIKQSLDGTGVVTFAFLFKLIFTAVTLGTGFLGGEVTPLFVIGSTLGFSLGRLFGVDPAFMAEIGFVAVFAGASNTPLACALMAIELFGGGSALYLILGTFTAYLASGHRSIYVTQRVGVPKALGVDVLTEESLEALSERRPGWIPKIPGVNGSAAQRLVRAVMSPDPIAVHTDTPIPQLIDLVVREGVRTLPVLDESRVVVGVVTDNDLLRRSNLVMRLGLMATLSSSERNRLVDPFQAQCVCDMMTSPAITVLQTETLYEAETLMAEHHLKRLPVVDQAGHLVGMITRSDLLRELAFSDAAPTWVVEGQYVPLGWKANVEQVMAKEPILVNPTTPLSEVIQAMLNAAQKRVIVVDDAQKAVGIITDGDLLSRIHTDHRFALLNTLSGMWTQQPVSPAPLTSSQTASDVMTAPVITVSTETTARDALRLLMEHQIKRLPVVDQTGHVVGIVGRAGLLRVLLARA